MTKNQAQIEQDYGVKLGEIAGIPVLAPSGNFVDAQAYNLVYDEEAKTLTLTAVSAG